LRILKAQGAATRAQRSVEPTIGLLHRAPALALTGPGLARREGRRHAVSDGRSLQRPQRARFLAVGIGLDRVGLARPANGRVQRLDIAAPSACEAMP